MTIFFGLWLQKIFSEARSFTTTSAHPGMPRRLTVRVFLFIILTSRLRVDLSTQDIEGLPVYNPFQQTLSYETQPGTS